VIQSLKYLLVRRCSVTGCYGRTFTYMMLTLSHKFDNLLFALMSIIIEYFSCLMSCVCVWYSTLLGLHSCE